MGGFCECMSATPWHTSRKTPSRSASGNGRGARALSTSSSEPPSQSSITNTASLPAAPATVKNASSFTMFGCPASCCWGDVRGVTEVGVLLECVLHGAQTMTAASRWMAFLLSDVSESTLTA